MSAIKIFISYAHEDVKAQERLMVELALLERKGLVEAWYDGKIQAGERWSDSIRSNLESAELVILLISPYFAASSFILEEELPLILKKHAAGTTKIIPILTKSTGALDLLEIDHLQCLPQDDNNQLKAISLWEQADRAWEIVNLGIQQAIESLQSTEIQVPEEREERPNYKLGVYHKYACDRMSQRDRFYELLNKKKNQKTHYFYLYGEVIQSHLGMFQRIAYDKRDMLLDYLNPDLRPSCQIVSKDITTEFSQKETIYKQNIVKSILAAFGIGSNEEEPILDKNINILLEKSPDIKTLKKEDFVCILLTISEWDWDKDLTPKIVSWILDNFFEVPLSDHAPNFLIFFGLTYEEQDGEMEQEIIATLENSSQRIKILPELENVEKRDIARWFARYKSIFESQGELKAIREENFPGKAAVDMEDVEIKLAKIIDAYNRR